MGEVVASNSEIQRKCIRTDDGTELFVNVDEFSGRYECFKLLFQYETEEEISIHGVPGNVMVAITEYVEQGTLKIADNVVAMLEASDYLQLVDVQHQILSRLPDVIGVTNCIELANLAAHLDHLQGVSGLVQWYIVTHFPAVVSASSSNMDNLALDVFVKILSDDNLVVSGEDKVLEALVRWVESDRPTRLRDVPRLLSCIRYKACSDTFIKNLMDLAILRDNEFCSEMLSNVQQQPVKEGKCNDMYLQARMIDVLGAWCGEESMVLSCRNAVKPIMLIVEPNYRIHKSCFKSFPFLKETKVTDGHVSLKVSFAGDCETTMEVASLKCRIPFCTFRSGEIVYIFSRCFGYVYDLKKATTTDIDFPRPYNLHQSVRFVLLDNHVYASWMHEKYKKEDSTFVSLFVASYNAKWKQWVDESTRVLKIKSESGVTRLRVVAVRDCLYVSAQAKEWNKGSLKTRHAMITARFNTSTKAWDNFETPPIDEIGSDSYMACHKDEFYFVGDSTNCSSVYKFNFVQQIWEHWPMPPQDAHHIDCRAKLKFVVDDRILFYYETFGTLELWLQSLTLKGPLRPMWRWDDKLATWIQELGRPCSFMTFDAQHQEGDILRDKLVKTVWKNAMKKFALMYPAVNTRYGYNTFRKKNFFI